MMKILLIHRKMNKRPMDTELKVRMAPSLALLTLMRLTPDGHKTVFLDENIEEIDFTRDADIVGITVTLDVMPRAIRIAEIFRQRGIPVVAGGIHVTCDPQACLPYFDAICIGLAERIWRRIVEDAAGKRLKRIYHDMANFRGDEIASPKYDAIDTGKYLYTNVVTTSRGCPNRCDFCYNSCAHRTYVTRPIGDVIKDILSLGTRHILFIDDNFIGTPSYARELLHRLHPLNLKWSAAVTTQILHHPDLLDLMAETGCQSLFIGFESLNASSLQSVHKKNRFEEYEELVRKIHRRGIMVNASMVFGLDGDHPDVFEQTLNWLIKNKVETLTSHILTPYPGTKLYSAMHNAERITDHDLSKYNTAHVVFAPKNMAAEELYAGYLRIYREFYSLRNLVRRMPNHKAQWKPYLLFNVLYRKFGKATSLVGRILSMRRVGRAAAKISYRVR